MLPVVCCLWNEVLLWLMCAECPVGGETVLLACRGWHLRNMHLQMFRPSCSCNGKLNVW